MTPHDELKLALASIRYPKGIVACTGNYCAIAGQSFFPGGRGHVRDELPIGGIMYLGHNFDKVSGFEDSVARGHEENLTWRKIRAAVLPILPESDIWFTNFFMGLIDGPTNMGALKRTAGFPDYESDCWDYLNLQVRLQRPRIIAVLGKEVVKVLGPKYRVDIPAWLLRDKDSYGPLRMKVHEVGTIHKGTVTHVKMIPAYHPSYGRCDKQLSSVLEDAAFISSIYRRNSPQSTN